jgi:Cu/Ag efflux protein CusF
VENFLPERSLFNMRKFSLAVLSFALVLGAVGLSRAAEVKHPVETAAAAKTSKGTVGSVDAQGKTFTLKSKAGDETYKVLDSATVKAGHKMISLADLKAGDWVRVAYTTSGSDKQALEVTVLGEAKPKAGK